MKKIILVSVALAGILGSLNASAATQICTGGGAGNAVNIPAAGGAGNFMVTAIATKCSANVFVQGDDGTNGSFYSVGSASKKGKSMFAGTTNGGSIAVSGTCAVPGGCTSNEAESARSTAAAAAGT